MKLFTRTVALMMSFMLFAPLAQADAPSGPVLLTVSGAITQPNRKGISEFDDAYFGIQEVEFDKARMFDRDALEGLGMQTLRVSYEDWPEPYTFEGPLLSDVLAAAGAEGKTIVARALDGYAPEIAASEANKYPIILALKRNGEYLTLGGRGPLWLIYPRNDFEELAQEDDAKMVWALYHIHILKE